MAGILTMLLSLIGCSPRDGIKGSNGVGDKAKDNESGLNYFYYHYSGSMGGDDFTYKVQEKDGKIILTYETMEHSDLGTMTKEVDEAFLGKLDELYRSCRLAAWDGYDKSNTMVLDGTGFSLLLSFNDGQTLSASGYSVYPPGHRVFFDAMTEIFEPVTSELLEEKKQEKIAEGLEGTLTSVLAVFKQQGASGSDSYEFLLTLPDIRETNFDTTMYSESLEFLPQGNYRLAKKVDEEYLEFETIQALIEKYELIKWYDWDKTAEEPNENEWFQLSFHFTSGQVLNAMGTQHPEHYEEFRQDFLQLMTESYKKVASLP